MGRGGGGGGGEGGESAGIMEGLTSSNTCVYAARSLLPTRLLPPVIPGIPPAAGFLESLIRRKSGWPAWCRASYSPFTARVWYNTLLLNRRDNRRRAGQNCGRKRAALPSPGKVVKGTSYFHAGSAGVYRQLERGAERIKGYNKTRSSAKQCLLLPG